MPNLPKLYYYIAGLAVFILILGSVGIYFYQRQKTPTISTNTIQTTQSSLTSNQEPAKTSNEANDKPKEENLTSTSFDADPNTDVIVFKECGISLKLQNLTPVKIFKNTYKDRASNIETYELKIHQGKSISDDKSESFECSLSEIRKDVELGFAAEYPSILG